ncbi:hypothetical protein LRB11_01035 [Ectothiorhodospira haloalkaliphila]|uniref:hypothetical protein n=1 Tax=Ectothiorhodospira haloalkaliphila TaxID=421628 RepID=UPI001EE8A190|nr:hypothetical protein [Ectothiorhodospira haloalkaliphila]MCG5523514.1 hypothetical protein [Ectothiorhodospira haloalkaliphila]
MEHDPILIELLGPPGVGKTLVSKLIERQSPAARRPLPFKRRVGEVRWHDRMRQRHLGLLLPWLPSGLRRHAAKDAYRRRNRRIDARGLQDFAHRYPGLPEYLLDLLSRRAAPAAEKVLLLDWFQRLYVDHAIATQHSGPEDRLLLDESFAQKAVTLFLHLGLETEPLGNYLSLVPVPNTLLVVEASVETLFARNERRGWPGWLTLGNVEDRYQLLADCRDRILWIAQTYEQRGCRVIRVSNDHLDRTGLAREVDQLIQKLP